MHKFLADKWARINGASGLVSEGQGMAASLEGGIGSVLLSSLVGAFLGLICGFMLSHLLRFCSMAFNRNLGGFSWVIYGAIVGAVAFGFLAVRGEQN